MTYLPTENTMAHSFQVHENILRTCKIELGYNIYSGRKTINQYEIIEEIGRGATSRGTKIRNSLRDGVNVKELLPGLF